MVIPAKKEDLKKELKVFTLVLNFYKKKREFNKDGKISSLTDLVNEANEALLSMEYPDTAIRDYAERMLYGIVLCISDFRAKEDAPNLTKETLAFTEIWEFLKSFINIDNENEDDWDEAFSAIEAYVGKSVNLDENNVPYGFASLRKALAQPTAEYIEAVATERMERKLRKEVSA